MFHGLIWVEPRDPSSRPNQFGGGAGKTLLAIGGAVAGAAAGTAAESKLNKQDAHKVTVAMQSGGTVTIIQPVDSRLRNGMMCA